MADENPTSSGGTGRTGDSADATASGDPATPPSGYPAPTSYSQAPSEPPRAPGHDQGTDDQGAQAPGPYGQGPYSQSPYSQNPYGQNPYGQNPYGQNPYGQGPYPAPQGPPPYGYGYPYAPPPTAGTNGMAVASLVLGILWIYWLGSILALIFGYVARKQIRESGQGGGGMATAGIVLGWIGIGVLSLILVRVLFVVLTASH